MKYISRHIENKILELSKSYSAILVTGPRQSGKTTMLRSLAEKENVSREYISLDDLNVRDMAKNDPSLFLQLHKPPVL
ncbi:MAG: AAA family ATPase, partial [[Eubacterium] siraeum]|nr:AAA family ATPase [[Eubacterium] siraeum]